ncbi:solute carrier organic anion transporter family member 74D-like [Helicoverpa zea]|uniref:solute carrier organic anion transporter family member 74D-like n=1 Tax=Helicoverpa zea TaxID=7113 RepID=UPI001F561E2C|nr:solute carrier organic anion transporter family member 74D-like [Helicoverpa zea]
MPLKDNKVYLTVRSFLDIFVQRLKVFDLFLQGAFLIVIILQSNVYLLLKRDAREGYHSGRIGDYVMIGSGSMEFLVGAAVAWWGRGRRQLALAFWLAVTSVAGLLVLAFPYIKASPAEVELCGGHPIGRILATPTVDNNVTLRTTFLIITALLSSITKLSVWAHGLTYLDDHDPANGPYFYGILISIRLSLGLSATSWLAASSVRDDWWQAHLSLCMLTLMFAILFSLFPTKMESFKEVDEARNGGADTSFIPTLGRLVRNKALVTQTVSVACLTTAVFVYVQYDEAYIQARYHVEAIRQDPRTSRVLPEIFRSLVIIFFVMIFRVRFSARRPDGVKSNTASRVAGVVAVFVAIFFAALAATGCNTGDMDGLEGSYQQPACSRSCWCNSERYGFSPVCSLDTRVTSFSPCHAGCTDYEDLNGFLLYKNCSCSTDTLRAVRGACQLNSCRLAYSIYQVVFVLMLAVAGACFLMQGMAVIRSVRPADKATAVGASLATVALLSFVIGQLIYMFISYQTCAYSSHGACLLHTPTLWVACATSAGLAVMAAIASLVASRMPTDVVEPTTIL